MNRIKEYFQRQKEDMRQQAIDNLRFDFKVKERNGALYLTHRGVAFRKIETTANAEEITKALEDARTAAIEFEGL